ncbi:calcium load-activated calcium channel [Olea europaea subsp. europaea]|uniref:Calcium load-activated calcium channel n=1 Tax=Olea europaea subsp. europaea TaxID=158383 RepID=A0A8S0UQV7_OLEEU|nr:calcium load-activated calcium channel [Olea europaea subsp. europaea]
MASALFSNLKYSDSLANTGHLNLRGGNLRGHLLAASKKLETMKQTDSNNPASDILKKSKTKKMDRIETSLKESSRDLSLSKFKSGAVVSVVLFMYSDKSSKVLGILTAARGGRRRTPLCHIQSN